MLYSCPILLIVEVFILIDVGETLFKYRKEASKLYNLVHFFGLNQWWTLLTQLLSNTKKNRYLIINFTLNKSYHINFKFARLQCATFWITPYILYNNSLFYVIHN